MSVRLHAFLARRAMTQAFNSTVFDMEPLEAIADILGVSVDNLAEYRLLRKFHRMPFSEMPMDVRDELFQLHLALLVVILGDTVKNNQVELVKVLNDVRILQGGFPKMQAMRK